MVALHPFRTEVQAQAGTQATPRWLAGWLGLAALGVGNGAVREMAYQPHVGESAGHQISTFTLLALVAGYAWLLQRRWPLVSDQQAWRIGTAWALMTLAFEFGFGRLVNDLSWETMLADYDVTAGNLWVLVPLAILVAPVAARRLGGGRER